MSIVTLVSGGLDSTLVARLAKEEGLTQFPLFIDYGQRARDRELKACRNSMSKLGLPELRVADLSGFGKLIESGLTRSDMRIVEDAFTPGRNMLFLLVASAYAFQMRCDAVSIGLLNESTSLFPDQASGFLSEAECLIARCMGRKILVLAPLSNFTKADVVALAKSKGIGDTYSCHAGGEVPCGTCIACKEFEL